MSATVDVAASLPSPVPPSQSVSPLIDADTPDTSTAVAEPEPFTASQSASAEKLGGVYTVDVVVGTLDEIHPPTTSPQPIRDDMEDVQMAEHQAVDTVNAVVFDESKGENGTVDKGMVLNCDGGGSGEDVNVMDFDAPITNDHALSPSASNALDIIPPAVSFPISTDLSEDLPPPAKRARKLSNSEEESTLSVTHITTNGNGMHSPARVEAPAQSSPPAANLSASQFRFCSSTIRHLKKQKDAIPFLLPVDPIALNIPHYHNVIRYPMDISTVERKLAASNPTKPNPYPDASRYRTADEFVADVRLIFQNCVTFNGMDHVVSQMGKRVEALFDKSLKQMPPNEEVKPVLAKPPPPPPPPKKAAPRRISNAATQVRRPEPSTAQAVATSRPKRDIHPPPSRELPGEAPKKRSRKRSRRDDGTAEQLKFCGRLLSELFKKQHYTIAAPFYEPVDYVTLGIPTYPKIVKKPIDLSTIKRKLETGEYSDAGKFRADFKLMIRNCFAFNPPGSVVNQAGVDLQSLFDEKWLGLPAMVETEEEDEDDVSDDDRIGHISALESQLATLSQTITSLKREKAPKKRKSLPYSEAGPSKTKPSKNGHPRPSNTKNGKQRAREVDEVLSFDQKKALSETIQTLDGDKLERVIQIIHEGVPDIRDSTEEIELDIDTLPASVLTKLYNFVLKPAKERRHAVGGVKRKTMDEESEAERMRILQQKIAMFDGKPGATPSGVAGGGGGGEESGNSSDSSSGSESSGSDSE